MSPAEKPVHVVFSMSAAASIRQALRRIGCADRVIGFPDDLSFGPIDGADVWSREDWIANDLGFDWGEVCERADQFWTDATSPEVSPVAWVCLNHAAEHAGFLEFVWRMQGLPFRVVDASDLTSPRSTDSEKRLWSLGILTPGQIVEADLLGNQASLSAGTQTRHRQLWQRLRSENAPFRVVDETGLRSAAITHFDEAIMACVTPDWQNGARVVGRVMVELIERPFSQCTGDLILWSRVLALVDIGQVELDGTGPAMRDHRVRLATGH